MKRVIKPLDSFEMECILGYFGLCISDALSSSEITAAEDRRLKDRARRFVLSHPDVTPELARVFKRAASGKDY